MNNPFASTAKRRDRVFKEISDELRFTAKVIWDANLVSQVVARLLKVLPKGCRYDAVHRSLATLLGTAVRDDVNRQLAWAVAANYKTLRSGGLVWPPTLPGEKTRVTLTVTAARKLPRRSTDKPGPGFRVQYRLRVVEGPYAPRELDVVWSSRLVRYLALKTGGLGFTSAMLDARRPGAKLYQHWSTLVGMFLHADLSAADGRPKLDDPRCSSRLQEFNRGLTDMRWRVGYVCPFEYAHPCHECEKGQDACPAACRPVTLRTEYCPACRRDVRFDPAWAGGVCTSCGSQAARSGLRRPLL